jgi:hypothetical protein
MPYWLNDDSITRISDWETTTTSASSDYYINTYYEEDKPEITEQQNIEHALYLLLAIWHYIRNLTLNQVLNKSPPE